MAGRWLGKRPRFQNKRKGMAGSGLRNESKEVYRRFDRVGEANPQSLGETVRF
jgi:hypothetical protein